MKIKARRLFTLEKRMGQWNDFANDNTNVDYYIIEYGGMPGETATTSTQINLTLSLLKHLEALIMSLMMRN